MSTPLSRRAAIGGLGLGAAAATFGAATPALAADEERGTGPGHLRRVYQRQKTKAGGVWHSHVAALNAAGVLETVIADDVDAIVDGYSVQKVAVAVAVMDKVDRGELQLGQKLDLQADIILGGSGIYHLHTVWGDDITVANFLTALLLVSDNTAVRMCGRVVPALEINQILAAKGFVNTRVVPVANPNRFFLGKTTPAEMHDLLWRLANKTLLSAKSCDFLLGIMRWVNGYHDGIRRNMSSNERSRVAVKYGADFNTLGAGRHEVGIMFDSSGAPALTFAFFADSLGGLDNYGATHPAVEAHAVLGRQLFDSIPAPVAQAGARTTRPTVDLTPFHQVNGG
ncbi:serine hydrolase [Catellatospora methionotrophica]|uniref:Beta-lactamase n=1 Tax=Catellatospora methionotrophica TaxID=121620 RepID=A0A8J3PJ16_9ACTN|nr:serine hydrolase [Catellatospora methionotrophica]GIG18992.1 serine hydrolase [Catellatospora methionotrophica]